MRDERGRFRPGCSGNPGGRPRTAALADRLRERLLEAARDGSTLADELVTRLIADALEGDAQARRLVWAYAEGLPVARLEVEQPESDTAFVDSQAEADALRAAGHDGLIIIDDIPRDPSE